MRAPNHRFYIAISIIIFPLLFLGFRSLRGPANSQNARPGQSQRLLHFARNDSVSLIKPKTKSFTIAAVGDVMFDRRVKSGLNANGFSWPFEKVKTYLDSDLAIANLESSTASVGQGNAKKDVIFQGTPLGADALRWAGIDVVSQANNHALDYGLTSLLQTKELLKKKGIAFAGAGRNTEEAYKPAILKVGDIKVGFLSFSDIIPFNSFPGKSSPGIAPARDPAKVAAKIKALSKKVHIAIVAFHFGVEYQDEVIGKQKQLAVAAIDAGADLVLGHHPHVVQGVAVYKKRLIAYSLGNFVFDTFKARTAESYILRIELDNMGKLEFARLLPVMISSNGQPSIAGSGDGQRILKRVNALSGKYSDSLRINSNSLVIKGDGSTD